MQKRYFFDVHCHFFNLDDVPIYPTLKGMLPVKSILAFGATLQGVAETALAQVKPMIQFFESRRGENLEKYAGQIWRDAKICEAYDGVILTPLVMDFSLIEDSREHLYDQTERLLNAISTQQVMLGLHKTRVFPFIGFDLRHLDTCSDPGQVPAKLHREMNYLFDLDGYTVPTDIEAIENGTILGIKLYPPIGFSPYPADLNLRPIYSEFFRRVSEKGVPVTVHCQSFDSGSYRPGDVTEANVDIYTDPRNWLAVLKTHKHLKINFAHFGGDVIFRNTFFKASQPYACEPKKDTWVWNIIELLKKYPRTYADVSAFDFKDKNCTDTFGIMLILDETGLLDPYFEMDEEIGRLFPLKEKILWGSDIPMVIQSWKDSYADMYAAFRQMLNLERARLNLRNSSQYGGVKMKMPDPDDLLERFVSINPERFLFHAE